jgi:WD40 repeat protein
VGIRAALSGFDANEIYQTVNRRFHCPREQALNPRGDGTCTPIYINEGHVYTMRRRHTKHQRSTACLLTFTIALLHCVADDHAVDNNWCVLGKLSCIYANRGQEDSPLIEINGGSDIWTVAFAANGEYIVGSGSDGLGVWRVEDGKRMATMAAGDVNCLAVSKDGRWIADDASVWDAKTFEKVFTHRSREEEDPNDILGVDFSPDSTRLLVAPKNHTATVWDIAARNKVLTLHSKGWMRAAKYSPQGDRIATATRESVRVWDSNDGRLLVDIPVKVSPLFNTGLIWSNNHLFVVSDSTIEQLEASTGSTVSKLTVADTNDISSIALPKHGEFIVYSTIDTVTFWDTSTHTQLGLIQHPQIIHSIAHSPDERFLAIVGLGGKITIRSLSRITVSTVFLLVSRI